MVIGMAVSYRAQPAKPGQPTWSERRRLIIRATRVASIDSVYPGL